MGKLEGKSVIEARDEKEANNAKGICFLKKPGKGRETYILTPVTSGSQLRIHSLTEHCS